MFTCMDITMAPGGQGGRWHILWTDPLFLWREYTRGSVGFFKEGEKGTQESISQWGHNKSLLS